MTATNRVDLINTATVNVAGKRTTKQSGKRVSYSFAEFADMVGKDRAWVYRQVKAGRIKAITGFGSAMIPAIEIDRIFGKGVEA